MTRHLPFFPPDLFEESRQATYAIVRRVGVAESQQFILGPAVSELEDTIAEAAGARHVIACASGTGALNLSVHALGIGPGDEVAVPAFCCQPVASSVANRGATPVFVDIDPWTMVMDPQATEAVIGPRTVAIMPAHVFSVMAEMRAMAKIADRHGVKVIEDAAVALRPFTCDAIWMQNSRSYTVVCGPGDLAANNAHADEEHVALADLAVYADRMAELLVQFSDRAVASAGLF